MTATRAAAGRGPVVAARQRCGRGWPVEVQAGAEAPQHLHQPGLAGLPPQPRGEEASQHCQDDRSGHSPPCPFRVAGTPGVGVESRPPSVGAAAALMSRCTFRALSCPTPTSVLIFATTPAHTRRPRVGGYTPGYGPVLRRLPLQDAQPEPERQREHHRRQPPADPGGYVSGRRVGHVPRDGQAGEPEGDRPRPPADPPRGLRGLLIAGAVVDRGDEQHHLTGDDEQVDQQREQRRQIPGPAVVDRPVVQAAVGQDEPGKGGDRDEDADEPQASRRGAPAGTTASAPWGCRERPAVL